VAAGANDRHIARGVVLVASVIEHGIVNDHPVISEEPARRGQVLGGGQDEGRAGGRHSRKAVGFAV
jgi:hypothetical protein